MASSSNRNTRGAVSEVLDRLRPAAPTLIFVFHSIEHDPAEVARLFHDAMAPATTLGCSTMGEIGVEGMIKGGISALGCKPRAFAVERVLDLSTFLVEHGSAIVGRLTTGIGRRPGELDPDRHLLITLIDGLSGSDATFAAALGLAAPGIPIVGGSAGDDGLRRGTWTFLRGEAAPSSALVVALEPSQPFVPFAVHHYRATDERIVITSADPETKRVIEIDGRPALEVYAALTGISVEGASQDPTLIRGLPVQFGVQVGLEFFVHSVMAADGSDLFMAVPVSRGQVLRVARARDLLTATKEGLARVRRLLPTRPSGALLFNCGGRLWEAERRDAVAALWEVMTDGVPCAGFHTYGEQFGPMLVNHTLTGVLFGDSTAASVVSNG